MAFIVGGMATLALVVVLLLDWGESAKCQPTKTKAKTVKQHVAGPFDLHFVGSCGFNIEAKSFTLAYDGTVWTLTLHQVECNFHTEELLRTVFISGGKRPHLEIIAAKIVYLLPRPVFSGRNKQDYTFLSVAPIETLPNYQVA